MATRQPTSYGADQGNSSALGSSFHVQPFGVMNVIGLLSPGCSYRRSAADDLMGIRWGAGLLDGRQRNGKWIKGLIIEDANLLWSNEVDEGSPEFIPVRDQIIAFKASGKSFEEFAEQIAQSPASSVYEGKTRLEVYGKEGANRHARQRWAMDVTHYDSIIDGTVSQGYIPSTIVPLIRCPTCFITSNQWAPTKDLQAIPGAVHVTINTADHRVHEVCPIEFTQTVKSFIATI